MEFARRTRSDLKFRCLFGGRKKKERCQISKTKIFARSRCQPSERTQFDTACFFELSTDLVWFNEKLRRLRANISGFGYGPKPCPCVFIKVNQRAFDRGWFIHDEDNIAKIVKYRT